MKSEDPDKIPKEIKEEHLRRKVQGMNLHICMTLHKQKLAELESQVDSTEIGGDSEKIRKLHQAIELEKPYGDILLHRQSVVSKQFHLACESYNHALGQTADCHGCKYLRAERNDPVKLCGYVDSRWVPVSDVAKCPEPGGLMLDRDLPPASKRQQKFPDHGTG